MKNFKIYTIFSDSHRVWFDILTDSVKDKNIEVLYKQVPQVSKTGDYGSDDIINFWRLKVEYILEVMERQQEPFLYSDSDVYVFKDFSDDLRERIKGKDILCQFEKKLFGVFPMVCAGFMYIRPNRRTKKIFKWILKNMDKFGNDQTALNRYLYTHFIKWGMLPKTYYSINYDNGDRVWTGEKINIMTTDSFIAHIHWAIGLPVRLKLLEMIRNHFENKTKNN